MHVKLTPLSHIALNDPDSTPVTLHNGVELDRAQFSHDVKVSATAISKLKATQFALFYEHAYPFCVTLFALLHTGKQTWIAANNKPATAEKLAQRNCLLLGEWQDKEISLKIEETDDSFPIQPINSDQTEIIIFTSGSSGQAKAIKKTLTQFQCEINALEKQWGDKLGQAQALSTVSHQHIYGLLFRILWPLAAGRCFHSNSYLSPEALLKAAENKPAYWVASPAQLKRLDQMTPWQDFTRLHTLFSSGGALSTEVSKEIYSQCMHKVVEIYGSSESGGIAWRKSVDDELWTMFAGITMTEDAEKNIYLHTPYLAEHPPLLLDDKIILNGEARFTLLGRTDRIVKVEEKRLSLNEMEAALNNSDWVLKSHTVLLSKKRDKIAAALVLTEKGKQQERADLIKQLRKQLMQRFENIVLPRKWLFMESIPVTSQDKIDNDLLLQLLSLQNTHFPQLQDCDFQGDSVELQFRVQSGLIYFTGHFPDQPILPGATQLAWAEQYGKIFFNIDQPFLRMEVIKFKKIIRPGDVIKMKLHFKSSNSKLYFELNSIDYLHSSGRMVYGYH